MIARGLPGRKFMRLPSPRREKYRPDFQRITDKLAAFCRNSGVKLGKQEVQSGSVMSHLWRASLRRCRLSSAVVSWWRFQHAGAVRFAVYRYVERRAVVTWVVESIGYLGFTFMIPIMALILPRRLPINRLSLRRFWLLSGERQSAARHPVGCGIPRPVVLGLAIGYFVFWFRKVRLAKHYNRCSVQC